MSVTIIVALTIPLAITLDRRARAELERESLVRAGTIAQDVGAENLAANRRPTLRTLVSRAAEMTDGRVIVVDASGSLIADSQGPATGVNYATRQRPEVAAALKDIPTSVIRFSQDLGVDIMATAVPIVDESTGTVATVMGAVRITQSMDQVNAAVRRVRLGVIGIGVGGLLAGLVLAFALSGSLARPLGRLADAAQRFGSGDLAVRAGNIRGPDEVERLAASFDQMAGQVQATVLAQREFAANASHQLRTPLTGMKLRLESAIADTGDEDVRAELIQTEAEVDRLSAIVDRLLTTASRAEARPTGVIDLGQVATQAVERWDAPAREAQTDLVADVGAAPALVDGRDVEQIIDNLLDNAIAYAPGRVEVSTGLAEGRAFVAVRDHGPGIAEPDFPHITERFYRGEGRRIPGSGLGLAIVQELAKQANGAVVITQPTGGGTRIEVRYPPVPLTAP